MPCMQWDLFSVLVKEEEVAGAIAVSDAGRRMVMINEKTCISLYLVGQKEKSWRGSWAKFSAFRH